MHELELFISLKPCYAKEQAKLLEDPHTFEFLGNVNPKYETIGSQILSQDLLPPIQTVYALLQGKEN